MPSSISLNRPPGPAALKIARAIWSGAPLIPLLQTGGDGPMATRRYPVLKEKALAVLPLFSDGLMHLDIHGPGA